MSRIDEKRKAMTRSMYNLRKKIRRKNAGASGFQYRGKGKVKISSLMRAAMRKGGVRLARIGKSSSVQHKRARTRKMRQRQGLYNSADGVARHSHSMLAAVVEYVVRGGDPVAAANILEGLDPRMTSTPIGVYGLDIAEKISETRAIGKAFVDVVVIDEETLGVCFEEAEGLTEGLLERELQAFGSVDLLAKPGDDIDEDTASDLYMLAITVPENELAEVKVDEDMFEIDDDGSVVVSEDCLDDDELDRLVKHPCFTEAASA